MHRVLSTSAVALTIAAATTGCGSDNEPAAAPPPTVTTTASAVPGSPRTPSAMPSSPKVPTKTATTPTPFSAQILKVSRGDLRYSWHQGCPVPVSGLRMIKMTYWGMDRKPHEGRLVVNASAANKLVTVFKKLYDGRYPIKRMEPVDVYKGSDFDSIEADNTSAFNCRNATGSSSWSQHAYGLAIDINPCENPYVTASGQVAHKNCVKFRNRSLRDPGVIHNNDLVVRSFRAIGWGWGGLWSGTKDYQHFSASGR